MEAATWLAIASMVGTLGVGVWDQITKSAIKAKFEQDLKDHQASLDKELKDYQAGIDTKLKKAEAEFGKEAVEHKYIFEMKMTFSADFASAVGRMFGNFRSFFTHTHLGETQSQLLEAFSGYLKEYAICKELYDKSKPLLSWNICERIETAYNLIDLVNRRIMHSPQIGQLVIAPDMPMQQILNCFYSIRINLDIAIRLIFEKMPEEEIDKMREYHLVSYRVSVEQVRVALNKVMEMEMQDPTNPNVIRRG